MCGSLFWVIAEDTSVDLKQNWLDCRPKDGGRICVDSIISGFRIERTGKPLRAEVRHVHLTLLVFHLGTELCLLGIDLQSFERGVEPHGDLVHLVFELASTFDGFIDNWALILKISHKIFPHLVVEIFHLGLIRIVIPLQLEMPM